MSCPHGCLCGQCAQSVLAANMNQQQIYGNSLQNYSAQWIPKSTITVELTPEEYSDYQMTKKYLHLTIQQLFDTYSIEHFDMKHTHQQRIRELESNFANAWQKHEEDFWQWMSKHRSEITRERFNSHFKGLL